MKASIVSIDELTPDDRTAMYDVLQACFEGVSPDQFDRDLREKDDAVLLRDDGGELVGFSTYAMYASTAIAAVPLTVVCSGDTIVLPKAWGSFALHRAWINAVHRRHRGSTRRLVWLLITSGYRTYRFLPVFFRRFVPRYGGEGATDLQAWMDPLADERWGTDYDSHAKVVRFARPQRLREHLAEVPRGKCRNRHVAHFLKCNPGFAAGDELVCLADLAAAHLTVAGRRMLDAQSAGPASRMEAFPT